MNITETDIDEMRRCAQRELNLRLLVYPKRVLAGKMKQEQADYEISGMRKIFEYFSSIQKTASFQQKLF